MGILLILLHHKVILLYESDFVWGGDLGLFWASCSEDQNMGFNEIKWT